MVKLKQDENDAGISINDFILFDIIRLTNWPAFHPSLPNSKVELRPQKCWKTL
jgi:hypothetical protein